jgi:radical SAM protein with 4Fe4S-binding SPASM domain
MKDHFCILPFIHMEIQPNGSVYPCCHSNDPTTVGNLHEQSLESIWKGKELASFQNEFHSEDSKVLPHCKDCLYYESLSAKSWRETENENWSHYLQDATKKKLDTQFPRSISIRFSNLCNFSCRTCRPSTSTAWFKDAKFLNPKGKYHKITSAPSDSPLIKQIEPFIEKLEHVYFAGGEPLMEKEHYQILELLLRRNPDVELSYDSNLSLLELGEYDAIELWKGFKKVNFSASVDGYGEQGEFIRKGLNWNVYLDNWNRIKKEAPHIRLMMNFTLSIYNMFHVLDFLKDNDESDLTISLVEEPAWQSLQALPEEVKLKVKQEYDSYFENNNFGKSKEDLDTAVKYMLGADKSKLLGQFRVFNSKIDLLRGESFIKLFPLEASLLGIN